MDAKIYKKNFTPQTSEIYPRSMFGSTLENQLV